MLFAENGIGRAVVESLAGAEAASLAEQGKVGSAIGALRFWKPIGIVVMTLVGGAIAARQGVRAILLPLAFVQILAVAFALLIHEPKGEAKAAADPPRARTGGLSKDAGLWAFIAAMILYHAANAPGGVYLGLFLKRDLHARDQVLSYAFAVSMMVWMVVVWPAGWLADRIGRKPLLIAGWAVMAVRLALVSVVRSPEMAVANQALDGLGNGLFAVLAASWVTDRLNDPKRSGEAQVIVGSCLVLGSAIGPFGAGFLVGPLGYRGLFWLLAGVGVVATAIVVFLVPETLVKPASEEAVPSGTVTDLSTGA